MNSRSIDIRVADSDHWEDIRSIFGVKGDASRCWCQFFIDKHCDTAATDRNREALHAQLDQRPAAGLVMYVDDEPAGWVQVGPRSRFERLNRREPDADGWALTCFVVPPKFRRKGISRLLLDAAIEHARSHGAARIRAYPIDTGDGRRPGDELYTGILSTFLAAGFHEVGRRRSKVTVEREFG